MFKKLRLLIRDKKSYAEEQVSIAERRLKNRHSNELNKLLSDERKRIVNINREHEEELAEHSAQYESIISDLKKQVEDADKAWRVINTVGIKLSEFTHDTETEFETLILRVNAVLSAIGKKSEEIRAINYEMDHNKKRMRKLLPEVHNDI